MAATCGLQIYVGGATCQEGRGLKKKLYNTAGSQEANWVRGEKSKKPLSALHFTQKSLSFSQEKFPHEKKPLPIQLECISISHQKSHTLHTPHVSLCTTVSHCDPPAPASSPLNETANWKLSTFGNRELAIIICHIINSSVHKKQWRRQWAMVGRGGGE